MTDRVEIHFEFFPEAWAEGVPERVFSLLVGPDRLFPALRFGNEGKQMLPEEPEELQALLLDHYERSPRAIQLFTKKGNSDFWFDLFRGEWHAESKFGSKLFWPKKLTIIVPFAHWQSADWLTPLVEVVKITEAPLVSLDYVADKRSSSAYYLCRNEMKRVLQATVHATAVLGPWRGLGRIRWARIYGRDIVDMLGTDRLGVLDAGSARDLGGGHWMIATTSDPSDSVTPDGVATERAMIQTLGAEHFFGQDEMRLAEVVPDFPERLIPDDAVLFERYGAKLKPL